MTTEQIIENLRRFNEWRRGNNAPQPDPTEIGKAIDAACEALQNPIRVSSVCRDLTRERDEARANIAVLCEHFGAQGIIDLSVKLLRLERAARKRNRFASVLGLVKATAADDEQIRKFYRRIKEARNE
jgi:hypothetical protein